MAYQRGVICFLDRPRLIHPCYYFDDSDQRRAIESYFAGRTTSSVTVKWGPNNERLSFPVELWYSPELWVNGPVNQGILNLTGGAGLQVRGPILALKYSDQTCTSYANAGDDILPAICSYFATYEPGWSW